MKKKTLKLSSILRQARKDAGLSQKDVATTLGLRSVQYISNVERSLNGIAPKHFKKISRAYKVPVRVLIDAQIEDYRNSILQKLG